MFDLFPTESIVLIKSIQSGSNEWGEPIETFEETVVERCLVAPSSTEDLDIFGLENRDRLRLTIQVPEAFSGSFKNGKLRVRGQIFKVIGDPFSINSPIEWNRTIVCESEDV